MSVFQPLYFAGGRYTAGTDRKLLAAVFGADSSGDRLVGVVPSNIGTDSLRVSVSTALTVNIATGMCLIADQSSQNNESPGLYLAGVDTNTESITLATADATDTKYDVIYAQVNETPYFVTSKALVSNVAELTTSSAHGFSTNETVVVSGVDDIFDGTYIITSVPSTTKFRYVKTHADVASFASPTLVVATATGWDGSAISTATISNKTLASNIATLATSSAHGFDAGAMVTVKGVDSTFDGTYTVISAPTTTTFTYSINKVVDAVGSTAVTTTGGNSVAVARVPFAIRKVRNAASGSSYPAGITAIELAEITVAANATSITQGNISDKRKFVPTSGGMHIYDGASGATLPGATNPTSGMLRYNTDNNTLQVYDSDASSFKTLYSNNASGEVFPRLGSTSTTAAAGDHDHNTVYAYNLTTGTTTSDNADKTISSESATAATTIDSIGFSLAAQESVLIIASCSVDISGSGQTTYVGIYVDSSTTVHNPVSLGDTDGVFNASVSYLTTLSAGSHTIYLKGYKSSGSGVTSVATIYHITAVPVKALT